ncbi:MAG: hypothetical protein GVY29_05155 [Spirochaetes bacterium]|nr:hypothetical protein [Spirochaetota bacterium]
MTETIILEDRVWVNTTDGRDECAIYLVRCPESRTISPGDALWWNGRHAHWTPYEDEETWCERRVGPKDVKIRRKGFSGAPRPKQESKKAHA